MNYEVLDQQEHELLDASGLVCPEPVMMLHNVIKKLPAGGLVKILATDSSTLRDIPRFCEHLGHELLVSPSDKHPLTSAPNTSAPNSTTSSSLDDPTVGSEKQQYIYWVKKKR